MRLIDLLHEGVDDGRKKGMVDDLYEGYRVHRCVHSESRDVLKTNRVERSGGEPVTAGPEL